jgi:hypothetical protein
MVALGVQIEEPPPESLSALDDVLERAAEVGAG